MLFWIFVIILIVSIIGAILFNKSYDTEGLSFMCCIFAVIMVICILVSGFIMIDNYGNADARVASNKEIYKSLTYQLENNLYDNDNDLGKKELYNQIQEWNKDVVYYQNIQDNFWFGIYWPNVFDQFETINYEAYN